MIPGITGGQGGIKGGDASAALRSVQGDFGGASVMFGDRGGSQNMLIMAGIAAALIAVMVLKK